MRISTPPRSAPSRVLATIVTLALVFGQMMQSAQAVITLLADQPIAAKVAAKPNIFYTLDDSGSMALNYIPEYVINTPTTAVVSAITRAGAIATVTLSVANPTLSVGDWVTIAGATQPEYDGAFQIVTIISPTKFTITVAGLPAAGSGAMTYTTGARYCRGGANTAACAQVLQSSNAWNYPPFFAGDFNRMMYNPTVTYTPPLKWDGLPFTVAVPFSAANIDANGNQGNGTVPWTKVQRDPYNQMSLSTVLDNLSTKVTVPVYCNTDWPTTAGANLAINPDVGDNNGEYLAGSGGWCRINGTKYDASAASGAPTTAVAGVEMGYNYPWQSSSGTVGAQYFFRNLTNKQLWCDKTSPYYPRSATITACNGGVAVTAGPPTQQSCNAQGKVCNPVVGSRNYTPAGCAAPSDPALWCPAGIGGSGAGSRGTGLLPECAACTCNLDTNPVPPNKCSSSGATCTLPGTGLGGDLAECPNIPNPAITSCTGGNPVYAQAAAVCVAAPAGVLFDPQTNLAYVPSTTLLADSSANGIVCRRNVQSYAVFGLPQPGLLPAGLAIYPRKLMTIVAPIVPTYGDVYPANHSGVVYNGYPAYAQTGDFTTLVNSGCPTMGPTVSIPRHYYTVDSVQFCNAADNTPDGQWRGFGTGVCQAKNDQTTFKYVQYGAFHRYDMIATTAFPSGKPWLAISPGPSVNNNAGNSESINYANWYANYATRLNAAKTTSANAFANLTTANVAGDYRVGFQNLGDQMPTFGLGTPLHWVDVADWTLAQRTTWYNTLFGIKVTTGKTPSIDAMIRIGSFVEFGPAQTGLDPLINHIPATAVDPFPIDAKSGKPISCTNNYHILFTDGTTNQIYLTNTIGDRDGAAKPTLPPVGVPEQPLATPALVLPNLKVGAGWPVPSVYVQGAPPVANTLSDVAAWYWARDLRHDPLPGANLYQDNVPSAPGSGTCDVDGTNTVPCDMDWTKDVAWWQHVNFSAISFGTEGTLDASNRPNTMKNLLSGALTWPDLTQPNNPTHPLGAGAGAVAVDDLWHATVMARGSFVNAKSPVEVSYGLSNILSGIQNQRKSRSSAAFSGQVLNATNDIIFEPTIEAGWAGDLVKVQIDPTTGLPAAVPLNGIWWNFASVLAAQIQPAVPGDEPWMLEAKRRVVTLANAPGLGGKTAGPGVPFQYASLTGAPKGPTMLASLAFDPVQQQKIIAYLRGGTTFNAGAITIEGTGIGQFRKRFARVGDISNAQPLIIGPPGNGYVDATDPGYSAFVAANAARSSFLVAPANDGLVHVVDAGPMPPAVAAGGGTELFAYIPKALFRGVAGNIATEDTTAIQSLTYQDGGIPIFHHHMMVDASPRVADVDFNNGTGAPAWHTIVVGGLGKGGNSYYALDVTVPNPLTEAAAASKVMWEWTDPDILYSYARPVIVKVRDSAFPTGRWVVLVTASYDNVSGLGKIYVLDAKTGVLLSTIATTAGSAANPSGLAQIHAFVKNETNQIAEQIYGGDLLGNFWRVDVSTTDSYKTAVPVLFSSLIDLVGNPQPVTTAPQIEIDLNNGIDRYVFIGTGRLLDEDDFTNPIPEQQQTMYAFRDGTLSAMKTVGLPVKARKSQGGIMDPVNPDGVSAIVGGAPNGWYHDLPNTAANSQRIVVDVQANVNVAVYIGTQIPIDPCLIQLPAFIYAHDYTTSASLLETGGTTIVPSIALPTGGVGAMLVGRIQADGTQSLGVMIGGEVPGTTPYDIKNPVTGPGARMSWRLLTGE